MKGSVIDAMSAGIEGADVMLFGVSESYKESKFTSNLPLLVISETLLTDCL